MKIVSLGLKIVFTFLRSFLVATILVKQISNKVYISRPSKKYLCFRNLGRVKRFITYLVAQPTCIIIQKPSCACSQAIIAKAKSRAQVDVYVIHLHKYFFNLLSVI